MEYKSYVVNQNICADILSSPFRSFPGVYISVQRAINPVHPRQSDFASEKGIYRSKIAPKGLYAASSHLPHPNNAQHHSS